MSSESHHAASSDYAESILRRQTRWSAANLFRNPFGELTRSERADIAVVDLDPILSVICESGGAPALRARTAYQLIGACGRGKTTRLLALQKRFPDSAYVYLPEDGPCPAIPSGAPLLIDEAQRLSRSVRQKVFDSGLTLALGTHRDLSRSLRRSGYIVRTERIGVTLGAERLATMLNRRIESSRRDVARPVPQISVAVASRLIDRFGTDIRGIESYLYDLVQSQVNHHGEMRFID